MAWSTPMTATAGAFSAAAWNTYVRDNLLETGPAKATATAAQWFVADGSHSIALRQFKTDYKAAEETRTSTSYGDLSTAGPSVTLTTGTKAIVMVSARMGNDTTNAASFMSFQISGATSTSPGDTRAAISDGLQASAANDNIRTVAVANLETLTAGSNTFTAKYKAASGTARFKHRTIIVWSF